MKKLILFFYFIIYILSINAQIVDPLSEVLIAHWRFNQNGIDASGNEHTMVLNGSAAYQSISAERSYSLDTRVAGAGASCNIVDVGDIFCISTWFLTYQYENNEPMPIISNTTDSDPNGFVAYVTMYNYESTLSLVTGNGTETATAITNGFGIISSNWHHVAFIIDKTNGTCSIYFNGEAIDMAGNTVLTDFASANPIHIGTGSGSFGRFDGFIDDVRISEGKLDQSFIDYLALGDAPGPAPNILPKLKVKGNKIIKPKINSWDSDEEVIFKGICYIDQGLGWRDDDGKVVQAHNRRATVFEDFAEIYQWGANCVRMMVTPGSDTYYESNPCTNGIEDNDYCERFLDRQIELAEYFGMYAIIDQHVYCHANRSEIVAFWDVISQRYADKTHVIYEIINEPSESECSFTVEDPWGTLKETVEESIDVIRSHDPNAIVIVNGLQYGYKLKDVATRPINRDNLIYGAHPYPGKLQFISDNRIACEDEMERYLDENFGYLTENFPVMLTEFAWSDDGTGKEWDASTEEYWIPLQPYLEKNNIGYLSFWFTHINTGDDIPGEDLALFGANTSLYEPTVMGSNIKANLSLYPGTRFNSTTDTPPYIAYVGIDGDLQISKPLTGNYTYRDIDSDPEGLSTCQWYRSDNDAGVGKIPIVNANGISYIPTAVDIGKYLSFEVTPVTKESVSGVSKESKLFGSIEEQPIVSTNGIYLNMGNGHCNENAGWINVAAGDAYTLKLGNGITLDVPDVQPGFGGATGSSLPDDVSTSYHHFSSWYGVNKKYIVHGLNPLETYDFTFLSSRVTDANGTNAIMKFKINSTDISTPRVFDNVELVSINDVTPESDGTITVEVSTDDGHGYFNAMVIDGQMPNVLIAHWPLDDNGNDVSGNNRHIANIGGGCFDATMSKKGSHARFYYDASETYLGEFDFNNSISISYWAKNSLGTNYNWIQGESATSGESFRVFYDYTEPSIRISSEDGSNTEYAVLYGINRIVTDYNYHHYMFHFDPVNNEVTVYIDGEIYGSGAFANMNLSDLKLWIGGTQGSNHCVIDDVYLFDGELLEYQLNDLISCEEIDGPTNFTANAQLSADLGEGFYKKHDVTLTWSDNSNNEMGYLITRSSATFSPCSWTTMFVGADETSYIDREVLLDHTCARVNYGIRAITAEDNSIGDFLSVTGITVDVQGEGVASQENNKSNFSKRVEKSIANQSQIVTEGTEVTYRAIPDSGWRFVEWTGTINSTENPLTFTVNGPTSLIAIFEEIVAETKTIQINFAPSDLSGPAGWNNLFNNTSGSSIANLIDIDEQETGYSIELINGWTNSSRYGQKPGIYPDNVMTGYFYVSDDTERTIELGGLNPNATYNISLFASRQWYDYTTVYTIDGVSQEINVNNNTGQTVDYLGLTPNTDGKIVIGCQRKSGSAYGYINAMVITSTLGGINQIPDSSQQTEYTLVGQINFNNGSGTDEPGWYNVPGGVVNGVFNLWDQATLTTVSGLWHGDNGDISGNTYPDNVADTYHYLSDDNEHYFRIENLDDTKVYKLSFFGSRSQTNTDRSTTYTVWNPKDGVSSLSATLNADGNTYLTADISDIEPVSGVVEFSVRREPASPYGYINALEIYSCDNTSKESNEIRIENNITVYPNPANDMLNIDNLTDNSMVRIYNIMGEIQKEIMTHDLASLRIPITNFFKGTYIIQIVSAEANIISNYAVVKQ